MFFCNSKGNILMKFSVSYHFWSNYRCYWSTAMCYNINEYLIILYHKCEKNVVTDKVRNM